MIESRAYLLADRGLSVELQITITDTTGDGIRKVLLRDRDRLEFFSVAPEDNCPLVFTFNTPAIPNSRFPIYVEGTDCAERVSGSEEPISLLPPGVIDGPGIPRACSPLNCTEPSPSCNSALANLEGVRRLIIEKCAEISALRAKRDAWIALAITFAIAAAILFAVAAFLAAIPLVGQGTSVILLAAGFLCLALAIVFGVLAATVELEIEGKIREKGALQTQFLDELNRVRENCCVECVSNDLTLPNCS